VNEEPLTDMTQTVTPYLLYEDGDAAIEFLTRAFGFREELRKTGAAGGLHAELEVPPEGRIYLGQATSDFRNPAVVGSTSQVYIIVSDVDAHHARAKEAGATIIEDLNDLPVRPPSVRMRRPQGHEWYFAQPIGGDADR
jgi:PhnB protein